jgi:hypothetical protein
MYCIQSEKPAEPMEKEAHSHGFYESEYFKDRLDPESSVKELFGGKRPEYSHFALEGAGTSKAEGKKWLDRTACYPSKKILGDTCSDKLSFVFPTVKTCVQTRTGRIIQFMDQIGANFGQPVFAANNISLQPSVIHRPRFVARNISMNVHSWLRLRPQPVGQQLVKNSSRLIVRSPSQTSS